MKRVIQIILITLVGTDVCVRMVFVWEETGVPGGSPPVCLGDHMTISPFDHFVPDIKRRTCSIQNHCVTSCLHT